ncbi:DUF1028 domain-containing protein [Brevibacillus fluminis]|uniref:DUF1028 domain-containing protein n=1 Tax=Brevibacillus fluminis TaxID=511487 RepID=A0A3M8DQH3_9BACL|nr:DUF1028 domain-containing protein [Brevibacillus fluminis]RNB89779.1 DUF1028 domain-containing protein [Brevibacillus fluminis]
MLITSTFSVAGRCESTGALGIIVTSSSPAVGARCPRIKARTGAILSQNVTDPRLSEIGLMMLEKGYDAESALRAMKAASPYPEYRQLAVVDAAGSSAVFSGEKALGIHGQFCAPNVASVGNLLCDSSIPEAMGRRFLALSGESLPDRLLASIETGYELGGELDQERSIALIVYTDDPFAYIDLRVDDSENPLAAMKQLWTMYRPLADAYKTRALTPMLAPSYGVKGDE